MQRLEKIRIRGFKSIRDLDINIRSINLLIGGNGSGKSNFISAFGLLREITEGRLSRYVAVNGGADRILHFGSKTTKKIYFKTWFNDSVNQYKISLEPTSTDELVPTNEVMYFWDKSNYDRPYRDPPRGSSGKEAAISQDTRGGIQGYVKLALESWRTYHFHDTSSSSPMKKHAEVDDNRFLRADAANLPSFLYLLRSEHLDQYRLIRNTVRRIFPYFNDFILEPRALRSSSIGLEWSHFGTDEYFDVSSFSDGTLRFIALTTLLLQPEKLMPSVILLDEPELGLHPSAINVLGAMIRGASLSRQIIVSTQSSLLLDCFEAEDVIVVERADGASVFSRLDSRQLAEWLKDYSLGELWEKNELGGKPGGPSIG